MTDRTGVVEPQVDSPALRAAPSHDRLSSIQGRSPISLFFAATGGGVQKMRVALANELAERGHEVHCVMPEATGPFLARLAREVEVVDLGNRNPLAVVRDLARYLRTARPGVLVAAQQHTALAAIWARRLSGQQMPLVISIHNTLSLMARQSDHLPVRAFMLPLARVFYRRADRIVAVSEAVADDLAAVLAMPRDRIDVIYNPVVPSDLVAQSAAEDVHPWLRDPTRPVILGVGNLIARKDFATLIKAVARLRPALPARLLILGEGPKRAELERLARQLGIADDIDLPGFHPNPFAHMARAAAFALVSREEGFGNVLVEALACGCPVVATDCPGGPSEILAQGTYGRLVPVGDPIALAAALEATIERPPRRSRLRDRGRLFSVEHSADRYLELIAGPFGA